MGNDEEKKKKEKQISGGFLVPSIRKSKELSKDDGDFTIPSSTGSDGEKKRKREL